ncbi:MAG: phage/plasmid replication protein, II/X family [Mariprofundaceae bacterium]|nr:phage/plasmid replication protein, II/X family [Mariprofundaceae bacterium]
MKKTEYDRTLDDVHLEDTERSLQYWLRSKHTSATSWLKIETLDADLPNEHGFHMLLTDVFRKNVSLHGSGFVTDVFASGVHSEHGLVTDEYFFLKIEGNFIKYLQGNSFAGTLDPRDLAYETVHKVYKSLGYDVSDDLAMKLSIGFIPFSRMDICEDFVLPNTDICDVVINSIVANCSLNGNQFVHEHALTKRRFFGCALAANHRRRKVSFYNKYGSLKQDKKAALDYKYDNGCCLDDNYILDGELNNKLTDHTNGHLRFEIKYKSEHLKEKEIEYIYDFKKLIDNFQETLSKVDIGTNTMNKIEEIKEKCPSHHFKCLTYWLEGLSPAQIKTKLGNGQRTKAIDQRYLRSVKWFKENDLNIKVRYKVNVVDKVSVPANVSPFVLNLDFKSAFKDNVQLLSEQKDFFGNNLLFFNGKMSFNQNHFELEKELKKKA